MRMMKIESAGTFITQLRAAGIISVSEVYQIARTTFNKHCADWKQSALIGDKMHLYYALIDFKYMSIGNYQHL